MLLFRVAVGFAGNAVQGRFGQFKFILQIRKKVNGFFVLHIRHYLESVRSYTEKTIRFSIIMNIIFVVIFISM